MEFVEFVGVWSCIESVSKENPTVPAPSTDISSTICILLIGAGGVSELSPSNRGEAYY